MVKRNVRGSFLLALSLGAIFFPCAPAAAAKKIFTGMSGADWSCAENWLPPGIPDEDDDVLIQDADAVIGSQTEAVATSVTVAGGAGVLRMLSLAGPGSTLTTGVITLGSDNPESRSALVFKSPGTLNASRIAMSPGEGESHLSLRSPATLNIGEGKGAISSGGGKGLSILEIDCEAGVLGLSTCEVSGLVVAQGNKAGTLDVTAGQMYTVAEIRLGNGENGETGVGTLNISGGNVNVDSLLMNAGKCGVANISALNLNSGRLAARKILRKFDGGGQSFHWNGGTIANKETGPIVIGSTPDATRNLVISLAGGGMHTFEVGDGWSAQLRPTAILADKAAEHGTLAKTGSGTLEIQSACAYTGTTIVSEGALLLSEEGSINSSSGVSVARSAVFTNQSQVAFPKTPGWLKKE